DLFGADLGADTAYVLGGETAGLGAEVSGLVDTWVSIPMAGAVESLNVSAAAAVVCFDVVRRGLSRPTDQPARAPR
ncbi:MAG: TrmH family RNA methyltransferase, partial [Candidatus Phosphoribacter baldrii]